MGLASNGSIFLSRARRLQDVLAEIINKNVTCSHEHNKSFQPESWAA